MEDVLAVYRRPHDPDRPLVCVDETIVRVSKRSQRTLDLTFPIRDVRSADLMLLKASCLWNAGIIDDRQRKSWRPR
jgi:hypothetical protein